MSKPHRAICLTLKALIFFGRAALLLLILVLFGVFFGDMMRQHVGRFSVVFAVLSVIAAPLFVVAGMGLLFTVSCDIAALYATGTRSRLFLNILGILLGGQKGFVGAFALSHLEDLASFLMARKYRILLLVLPQTMPILGILHYIIDTW